MMKIETQFKQVYYVYIVTNEQKSFFDTGVTIDLPGILKKLEKYPGERNCIYLVYYERFNNDMAAVQREMKLSDYSQRKLKKLVHNKNKEMIFLNEFLTEVSVPEVSE